MDPQALEALIERITDEVTSRLGGRLDVLVHAIAFANPEDLGGEFIHPQRRQDRHSGRHRGAPGRLSRSLHRRQEQSDQDADDGDYHQQLHQSETATGAWLGSGPPQPAVERRNGMAAHIQLSGLFLCVICNQHGKGIHCL